MLFVLDRIHKSAIKPTVQVFLDLCCYFEKPNKSRIISLICEFLLDLELDRKFWQLSKNTYLFINSLYQSIQGQRSLFLFLSLLLSTSSFLSLSPSLSISLSLVPSFSVSALLPLSFFLPISLYISFFLSRSFCLPLFTSFPLPYWQ